MEGNYLNTKAESSDRNVRTSEKGGTGMLSRMPIQVRRILRKGSAEGAIICGGFWRRWPSERNVDLL